MSLDDMLRVCNVVAATALIATVSPAIIRIATRRARYFDPLWLVVALLALNRLSFLFRISQEASHASALILIIVMAWLSIGYQRHDRS